MLIDITTIICYSLDMKLFLTNYRIKNSNYGTHVWAKNRENAEKILSNRGLNETIINKGKDIAPTDHPHTQNILGLNPNDFHHALCFVSFVALKAGKSLDTILGDEGIVHEIFHLENTRPDYVRRKTAFKKYRQLCEDLGLIPK